MGTRLRLASSTLVLVVVGRWLAAIEVGPDGWSDLPRWYARSGPAPVAVGLLRVLAVGMVAWIVMALSLQLLSTAPGLARLRLLADAISPALVRRIGGGLVSLSVTAGLGAPTPAEAPRGDQVRDGVAVMQLIESGEHEVADLATRPVPAAPAQPTAVASAPAPVLDTAHVDPGDSLWSIAEAVMSDRPGPQPSEVEVARYWRRLVELNRGVLLDPGNPDLIYPGQVLQLPER